jgi:cytochrome P450
MTTVDHHATTAPIAGTAEDPVRLPDGSAPDPYALYDRMRQGAEVHVVEEPTGLRRFTFVRYDEARRWLADPRLTKDPRAAWDELLRFGYATGDPDTDRYLFHLLNTDPPEHTRLRAMVQRAFTTGRVAALRPRVEQVVAGLLDGLDEDRQVDLIADYALPIAVRVIGELIGVPTDDFDEYHVWASAGLIMPGATGAPMSRAEAYGHMHAFFRNLVAVKQAALRAAGPDAPVPDLLSGLIAAREAGDPLTEQELVALVIFLLNTGQEPTVGMIANGVLALLRHPDQLALLRGDPDLLPGAVEEFLRFDGPVALSTLRIAREDIEIDGTVIPRGGIVSIIMSSADRDPRRFVDADRLDITRADNPHLAFGHGMHRCVGVPLARVIGHTAIGALLARYPDLGLAVRPDELRWRPTRVMRGLVALPVRLGRSA